MATMVWALPVTNGFGDGSATYCTLAQVLDGNLTKWVAQFPHDATTRRLAFSLMAPDVATAAGNLTCRLRWRVTSGSGNVRWKITPTAPDGSNPLAGATTTVTDATKPAYQIQETTINLGVAGANASIARGGLRVDRLSGDAADTYTGTVELFDVIFEHPASSPIESQYIWVCANAGAIPAASTATFIGNSDGLPEVSQPNGQDTYADYIVQIPADYAGSLQCAVSVKLSEAKTARMRVDAARLGNGADTNPVISAGTEFSNDTTLRSLPVTVQAGDTVLLRVWHIGTSGSDNTTLPSRLEGFMLKYNVNAKNPVRLRLSPGSGSPPSGTGASIVQDDDSHTSKRVAQFPAGSDSYLDFISFLPAQYSNGGTLNIVWRSAAAAGSCFWKAQVLGLAVSGDSSGALGTAFSQLSAVTAGANKQNTTQFSIVTSPNLLAASETLFLRIYRNGSDPSDSLAGTAEVLDIFIDFNLV